MKFLIPALLLVTTQTANLVYQGADNFRERLAKSIRDQVDRKLEAEFQGAFNKNVFPWNTGIKRQTNYNKYDFRTKPITNLENKWTSSNSFSIQPVLASSSSSFSNAYENSKPQSFSSNFNDRISIPSKQASFVPSNTVIQPINHGSIASYQSFPFRSYNSMRNDPFFNKKWYETKPYSQTSSFYTNPISSQSLNIVTPTISSNNIETTKTSFPYSQTNISFQNYASPSFVSEQYNKNNQYDKYNSLKTTNLIEIEPLKPILLTPLPFDSLHTTYSSYSQTPITNYKSGDYNNWSSLSSSISNNGDLLRRFIT